MLVPHQHWHQPPPQVSLNFDEIMLLTDNSTLRYLSLTSHLSVAMDISFKSGELWGFLSILQSLLLLCLQHDFPSECTPVGSPAGGVRQPLQAGPQELLCPVLSCRRLSICSNHFMETATTNSTFALGATEHSSEFQNHKFKAEETLH